MPRYRSRLLGCGPRATEHVDAYRDMDNMEMVAVCDLLPERRQQFMERFGIDVEYDDYETALAQEQPDIVHICSSPGNRVWEAECAAKAGVKVALFEKPVAIRPADMTGLRDVLSRTDMKVAVNCQRRYFPQFRDGTITRIMKEELGDVYFIRASTGQHHGHGAAHHGLSALPGGGGPGGGVGDGPHDQRRVTRSRTRPPRASWPVLVRRRARHLRLRPLALGTPKTASGCTYISMCWAPKVGCF